MLQHTVCFKFKDNTPPEAVQHHLDTFAALQDSIPEIVAYTAGRVLHEGESSTDYDVVHYVTFKSKAELAVYLPHEAHQRFIEANKAHWANVLVLDSEIES